MKTYRIRKVLLPTDFSDIATNAVATAVAICQQQSAQLVLIHVVENIYLFPPEAGFAVHPVLPELVEEAAAGLRALAKKIETNDRIVAEQVVQTGNPGDEVCRWAVQHEVDLIVMGTHGASGLREFFIGSNAYRVVKVSPCPVLTIPGNNRWLSFRKILFPVRVVPHALDKYEVVRPIIQKSGSSLVIAGIVKRQDAAGQAEMKILMATVQKQIEDDHIVCSNDVYQCDDVGRQVLDLSLLEKPDMIVITATLDASIRDFFVGPYTQKIVNHARFPVLSIRPENC